MIDEVSFLAATKALSRVRFRNRHVVFVYRGIGLCFGKTCDIVQAKSPVILYHSSKCLVVSARSMPRLKRELDGTIMFCEIVRR
jgi:hypothetical protein